MIAEFEWDPAKALANVRKHGVDFIDAVTVFDDDRAVTVRDPDVAGEDRWISVGVDAKGRILVISFAPRGEHVRLISARRASRNERNMYMGMS